MSADSLNYCANSGLISELIGELTGDDMLVRYVGSEIASEISPLVRTLVLRLKITLFMKPFSGKHYICPFLNSPEHKVLSAKFGSQEEVSLVCCDICSAGLP